MSKKGFFQFLPYDVSHFEDHRTDPTGGSRSARSVRDAMGPNARVLYDRAVIPPALRDIIKDKVLFKKGITTIAKGEDHFDSLERNYLVYVLNKMHAGEWAGIEMKTIHRYVSRNMFGDEEDPTKDDNTFWQNSTRFDIQTYPPDYQKVSLRGKTHQVRVPIMILTRVATGVKFAQQEMYELLRSSLRLYMKRGSWDMVDAAIKQEEDTKEDPEITDANFLQADNPNRIKWKWIKTWVKENLCTLTFGSYYYRVLFLMRRNDDEARHVWTARVLRAYMAVFNYGNGWDKISSRV